MQATRKEGGFPVHLHTSPYGQDVRGEQMARSSSTPNRTFFPPCSEHYSEGDGAAVIRVSASSVRGEACVRACVCALEPAKYAGCIWNSVKGSCLMLWPKGWFGLETMKVSGPVRCTCTLLPFTSAQEVEKKKPWCTTAHSHARRERFIKLLLSSKMCICGPRRQKYGRRWRPAHVCGSSAYLRDKSLQGDENREWKIEERGGRLSST